MIAIIALLAFVCGASVGYGRRVSYWLAPETVGNATIVLDALQAAGGTEVATILFLYCGDTVNADGSFTMGSSSACDWMIPRLGAMGIGSERIIGSPSIDALRTLFKNPNASMAAMVDMAKQKNVTGVSWDVEPSGSTWEDAIAFGKFNAALKAQLNPLNIRLTTYSNAYNKIISDIPDFIHGFDVILGGETYNGMDFAEWKQNYEGLIKYDKSKTAPGMLASTERGAWNCETSSMQQRLQQLLTDDIPELALFSLDPIYRGGGCIKQWFPYAMQFVAAK